MAFKTTNFLLDATTTISSDAGAIIGGGAARTYSGSAGIVNGVRSEFDQAYYSRKISGLIALGIDARRKELHDKMKLKHGFDISDYTVEEAVSDAILYHGACSMDSGLDTVAETRQIDYNLGVQHATEAIERVKRQ